MKTLSNIITVSIFLIFGIFVSLTSFPNLLSAAPTTDPPTGDVIPTFSGLHVTGEATVDDIFHVGNIESIYPGLLYTIGYMSITDPVRIAGTMWSNKAYIEGRLVSADLYTGNGTFFGDLSVSGTTKASGGFVGPLDVNGSITSTGNIGLFTLRTGNSSSSLVGSLTHTVYCMSDEILVGCSGYISPSTNTNMHYRGSYHYLGGCRSRAYNNTTSTMTLYSHAVCFAPDGDPASS